MRWSPSCCTSIDANQRRYPLPLKTFLLTHRRGHFEYFATAGVMLLRAAGIPARYAADAFESLEGMRVQVNQPVVVGPTSRHGETVVVANGGETSGAVTTALGAQTLTIGREIAPGVPWCYGRDAGGDYALALKSGNFGGPEFFTDAIEMLEET